MLDVRQGRVVHAAGGDRRRYPALSRRFPFPDDPAELAGRLRERWGDRPLYLADLDALSGDPPDLALVEALSRAGHRLRVDAAVRRRDRARALLRAGARQVVVGLETLAGWEDLERVAGAAGRDSTVFSLDVDASGPHAPAWRTGDAGPSTAEAAAEEAAARGAGTVQLLDLERVGSARGPALERLRAVRAAVPGVDLAVGGGIRGAADVRAAARAGCDECLVATALYGGELPPATVRRLEGQREGVGEGEGGSERG